MAAQTPTAVKPRATTKAAVTTKAGSAVKPAARSTKQSAVKPAAQSTKRPAPRPVAPTRSAGSPASRERPRSEEQILTAALDLLLEEGPRRTTIEAIAARAGVSKVTIYRWWPNRAALMMSAFLKQGQVHLPYFQTVDKTSIADRLGRMAQEFSGSTGQMIKALVGESQFDPEVAQAFRTGYMEVRRKEGTRIIEAAIKAGQIRKADPAVILDMIYAPLWFRLLIGHEPLTKRFIKAHVELIWNGLGV